ncbi:MAG: xanthine dehydrogenase accessory factor, partial [Solirubrobacteraceae bacterium]|nr:xanthine dehydrogenase accessory factor [Solirubrobacteraceae bacterium]
MRPVQHTAARVAEWLGDGRRVAAGTLVGIEGSAPLDVGASVYVDEHGTIEGSVTGGCVESA